MKDDPVKPVIVKDVGGDYSTLDAALRAQKTNVFTILIKPIRQ